MINNKTELSIKITGVLFILVSLLRIPLVIFLPQWFTRIGIDLITLELILGYFLIKRAYWARIFGMIFGFANVFAYWTYAHSLYVDQIPQVICYFRMFFYGCFFLFLLLPPVKRAFGPPPYLKKIGSLPKKEIVRIKLGVNVVAILLVLHGVLMIISSDWLSRYAFSEEGKSFYLFILIVEIIIAIGLFLRRKIMGRIFGLMLSFLLLFVYIMMLFVEPSIIRGIIGMTMAIFTIVFFSCIFFFLAHPRTKAFFHSLDLKQN